MGGAPERLTAVDVMGEFLKLIPKLNVAIPTVLLSGLLTTAQRSLRVMVEAALASLRDGAASEDLVRATHRMLEEPAHAFPTHAEIPNWMAEVSKGISDASRATDFKTINR
eukprot:638255-Pyramimonas_sp.AAC.1